MLFHHLHNGIDQSALVKLCVSTFYKQTQHRCAIFNWHSNLSLPLRLSHALKVSEFKPVSKHVHKKTPPNFSWWSIKYLLWKVTSCTLVVWETESNIIHHHVVIFLLSFYLITLHSCCYVTYRSNTTAPMCVYLMDLGHWVGSPVMCVTNFVWAQSDILHARARHDRCVTNECAVVKVNTPISRSLGSWNRLECKTGSFVADRCILGIASTCHLHRLWKHPFAKLDERGEVNE